MKCVFIGGCVRSGTTLLGALLGGHSDCICTPESRFKVDLYPSYLPNTGFDPLIYLSTIQRAWRYKIWQLDLDDIPEDIRCQLHSFSDLILWLVQQYGCQHGRPAATVWIDHTPGNLRYLTSLRHWFPNSQAIHIVRDGRAVAASLMPLDWGPNLISDVAAYWVKNVAFGLAAESRFSSDFVMRVRYEDLVLKPEETLKTICRFLNLDYQSDMMKGAGFRPPQYTSAQHHLVGQPVLTDRVQAWEKELTPRQIEIFENLTFEFLTYLGYALKVGRCARGMTWVEKYQFVLQDWIRRKVFNKTRQYWRRQVAVWGN